MAKSGSDIFLSDPPGQDFGPYKLVRRLGVGGMAETYEAIRTGPGNFTQRVCLKVVLPFYRDRQDFRQLFEQEARLAAKLRHSNIVGVIDFGEIDGVVYIALELVDGVDLGSMLDAQPSKRLPHEYVALIGHELAAALEHAHDPRRDGSADDQADNAIIHRDVSPSNVLVSRRGEILLTDFGVAKAITGTWRQQSAVKGKVPYMSPEQLRAERLDGRADLFALGVVLFEALSGERPFQGEHDPATIMQILNGQRASLQGVAPATPPELCEVVESLLATDRDDRPQNAGAVLELLDPFVPPPRKRRELGNMASELRDVQVTRSSEPPISGSEVTDFKPEQAGEASGVSRTSGSLASEAQSGTEARPVLPAGRDEATSTSRRGLAWAFFGIVATLLAIMLWPVLTHDSRPEEAPVQQVDRVGEPAAESTRAEAKQEVPEAPPIPAEAASDTAPVAPLASARPARLTVVVFPWGDVWIDGKRRGSAPLKNVALQPGRYKIGAGRGNPTKSRTIRLREAERKTIQFDLTK